MSNVEKRTANLILVNSRNEVLLQLRDDIPTIPYPNTWCLPGGHIEGDETAEECLSREMREEMGIAMPGVSFFTEMRYPDEIEYFFVARMDVNVLDVDLKEGQAIAWFSFEATRSLSIAHNDKAIVESFFAHVDSESPAGIQCLFTITPQSPLCL
jgi:8-oxo-dGTP diphosphatase